MLLLAGEFPMPASKQGLGNALLWLALLLALPDTLCLLCWLIISRQVNFPGLLSPMLHALYMKPRDIPLPVITELLRRYIKIIHHGLQRTALNPQVFHRLFVGEQFLCVHKSSFEQVFALRF